jgi:hypothetical protein
MAELFVTNSITCTSIAGRSCPQGVSARQAEWQVPFSSGGGAGCLLLVQVDLPGRLTGNLPVIYESGRPHSAGYLPQVTCSK